MAQFHFRCSECGRESEERPFLYVCPTCAERQQLGGVTRGVLEIVIEDPPAEWPDSPPGSAEFLTAFLPVDDPELIPPLPVGNTPLLDVPRLRTELGMGHLWVKDDTRNPSGSTKDRASQLVVAKAGQYGIDTIATASTGNAATALAAVSAAAGLRAVVFVPAGAPPAKLVQMLSYGAELLPVDGSYDDAFELSLAACQRFGWFNRNTAYNPFTIEGKKTAALEIAATMSPEPPDAVIVTAGDGVITAGLAKGFADLESAGLIPRRPRLIVVQPEGSAALVAALSSSSGEITPIPNAASVADSLVVQAPRNAGLCLRQVRTSRGTGVVVDDEAIIAAIHRLAALTGVFAEPAAAAALAGLDAALADGVVDRDERVVLMITGSGLKDVAAARRAVEVPEPVTADLDAVARRLDAS
ncbi:MAG: threonine synthase [Thermoanaerobaculales bacterium]|jgi:threonine synthase|nr:threonine synthase [Thermoanaerobaculales bacterium]